MTAIKNLRFCGIAVSEEELELIKGTISDCANLSRTELAFTVCELLDWRRPNGYLKGHECRTFLEELDAKGILRLPALASNAGKRRKAPVASQSEHTPLPEMFAGKLSEVGPVKLELVSNSQDNRQWREWVGRHHYLGCKVPFGAHVRYFVLTTNPHPRRVGCLQVSSPAWMMAPRDAWIGWDHEQRKRKLQWIVQNSRFLILPWVKIPYLASATLARLARRIADDWEPRYAIRPVLMETLVDSARFSGTCYRAANWTYLGQTTGRGRMDKQHKRVGAAVKDIFIYPLCRKARQKLLEE